MKIRLGKSCLRVHPLLPILWGIVILTGQGKCFIPAILSLFIHEFGHILAAICMRQQIETLEITPLGGIITLSAPETLSPWQAFFMAAAGPICSFTGCFLAPWIYEHGIIDSADVGAFLRSSVLLFLINLLPVLPLDGGRMAEALCAVFFPALKPRRVLYFLGAAAGMLLCLLTLVFAVKGQLVLAPLFAGVYLFYAASQENRQEPIRYATALIARRQKLDADQALPVQILAAGESAQAKKMLKSLSPGKYHIILVLSRDGTKTLGFLDESVYCDSILGNQNQTLGQIYQSLE